jgi:hypothetical protein
MQNVPEIGIQIPHILLPKPGVDLTKWAVIACDQFTSEPGYWQSVQDLVGDSPSTFHMILPEVFLGTPEEKQRVQSTQAVMRSYLDEGIFTAYEGLVLVERIVGRKARHGLMLALDLEKYDYNQGSQTLIRATEGTILDRLPPRIKIRQGACIELPHILVLIDDPEATVIEPLLAQRPALRKLYDFELMLGSGHLNGYFVDQPPLIQGVTTALQRLADANAFHRKYGLKGNESPLLFAMGDGNHSLATAKAIWEKIKPRAGMSHPARYALVEIENVHDTGLSFEPIHRVLFDVTEDYQQAMKRYFGDGVTFQPIASPQEMVQAVDQQAGQGHTIGIVSSKGSELAVFPRPVSNLPVGTLQPFLDDWLKAKSADRIDYVHGEEVVLRLSSQPGNLGFYLPVMPKSDLFKTVILDGALPRKTFSMGEAKEKRFYMECREIC